MGNTNKCRSCGSTISSHRSFCSGQCKDFWSLFGYRSIKKNNGQNQSYVYFIQDEHGGPIKIGVSENPAKRLAGLQTGYPYKLKIILAVSGFSSLEQALHAKFNESRLMGEWFKPTKQLKSFIRKMQRYNGVGFGEHERPKPPNRNKRFSNLCYASMEEFTDKILTDFGMTKLENGGFAFTD